MDLKQKFIAHFANISPLSSEEAAAIASSMAVKTFPKGTVLVREGQVAVDTYFVLAGCIRQYHLVEGEEVTTAFFTEDQWAITLNNFSHPAPATFWWVCNEETTVSMGNEAQAQAMFREHPRFETIARQVMERAFLEQQQAMASFRTDSPEQRYLKLVEGRPDLVQRTPQYQIASYIGVKPESLSRIRKRLMGR